MNINLVLSGGGSRGFAHLGSVKALREIGIQPIRYSGTSAGAIAGTFLAAGYQPEEILKLFIEKKLFKMFRGSFSRGLLGMGSIEKFFKENLPANFQDLKFPIYVSATDIVSGTTSYFNEGELIRPLLGSCASPGLFKPVEFDDALLVDGGVLNNLPLEPLLSFSEPMYAIHVNPVHREDPPKSTWSVLERTFQLGVYSNVKDRIKVCNYMIEPAKLNKYKVFDYSHAKAIYKIGYDEVMHQKDRILSSLIMDKVSLQQK
jgi:NTE family protein